MSIVVFAESTDNQYKKSTFEAISFAREISQKTSGPVIAVSFGNVQDAALLGKYGADEVIHVSGEMFNTFNAEVFASAFAEVCNSKSASEIIISNTYNGKSISGRVAAILGASLVSNIVDYPETTSGFKVKRSVFSGKAFAWVNMTSPIKILAITPNSFETQIFNITATSSNATATASSAKTSIVSINKVSGKIPLTEAEIVVSGGRGMKGPENWGMIEELAELLGAATACSKPVSDMDWRPHSEHVGQTGITIKPNLYIAVGISGAIQHLAGVSSSKVIVAINKDPEAPFFKAADYGIIGDAFDVLPKLIESAKALKS